MGQQQLLLVILVTIIVGIATVVAINTFSSAADSANVDAVRQDIASLAASAQSYYMKPDMLGGGGKTFTGITFDDLAFPTNGAESSGATTVSNENGNYSITVTNSGADLEIDATPSSAGGLVEATVTQDNLDMGSYNPEGTEVSKVGS